MWEGFISHLFVVKYWIKVHLLAKKTCWKQLEYGCPGSDPDRSDWRSTIVPDPLKPKKVILFKNKSLLRMPELLQKITEIVPPNVNSWIRTWVWSLHVCVTPCKMVLFSCQWFTAWSRWNTGRLYLARHRSQPGCALLFPPVLYYTSDSFSSSGAGLHVTKETLDLFFFIWFLASSQCSVWSVLSNSMSNNISGVVLHDVREIESWITRLISCPVPSPGKNKVVIELLPPEMQVCWSSVWLQVWQSCQTVA